MKHQGDNSISMPVKPVAYLPHHHLGDIPTRSANLLPGGSTTLYWTKYWVRQEESHQLHLLASISDSSASVRETLLLGYSVTHDKQRQFFVGCWNAATRHLSQLFYLGLGLERARLGTAAIISTHKDANELIISHIPMHHLALGRLGEVIRGLYSDKQLELIFHDTHIDVQNHTSLPLQVLQIT